MVLCCGFCFVFGGSRTHRPAYIYRIASIKTELNLINFISNGATRTVCAGGLPPPSPDGWADGRPVV